MEGLRQASACKRIKPAWFTFPTKKGFKFQKHWTLLNPSVRMSHSISSRKISLAAKTIKIQCECMAFKLHCYISQLRRHSKSRNPESHYKNHSQVGFSLSLHSPKQRITNHEDKEPNAKNWNSHPECREFWNIKFAKTFQLY